MFYLQVPSKQGPGRGRKPWNEGDVNVEEEDVSTTDQPKVKQIEQNPYQSAETPHELVVRNLEFFYCCRVKLSYGSVRSNTG